MVREGDDVSDEPLIILNPAAGHAQRRLNPRRLKESLRQADLPDTWEETTPERGADAIIAACDQQGPVVVLGGDGTVAEAAAALKGTDRPLAIVPLGTGNVMALRLSIPLQVERALRVVRDGLVRRLDVGLCDGDPFLLSAGMGFDARIMRLADRHLKRQMGKLAYFISAARNFPIAHHSFTLECDGATIEESAATVLVSNLGTQAGPWIFPPNAEASDGLLDVAVIQAESLGQVVSVLTSPFRPKERDPKGIRLLQATRVSVRCEEPIPRQLDGDDLGDGDGFTATVEPQALVVMVSRERPVQQWGREWLPDAFDWPRGSSG